MLRPIRVLAVAGLVGVVLSAWMAHASSVDVYAQGAYTSRWSGFFYARIGTEGPLQLQFCNGQYWNWGSPTTTITYIY